MPNNIVDITLPSLAEFWLKNYNFEKHGFYVSDKYKNNYKKAYAMVFSSKEPKRYCLIFLSSVEL